MKKEQWIKELTKLFEDEAKIKPDMAKDFAESLFENSEIDILDGDYSPTDAFADEMEEWAASA